MRTAQRQAAVTLVAALAFLVAAVAVMPVHQWTGRWLPLHLFLAGTLGLAISGASVFFAVTWSAAPAPPGWAVAVQRAGIAAGAIGVSVTRAARGPTVLVVASGAVFVAALAALCALLVVTVARGVERRFDVAVAWYGTALAAGVAGVSLGIAMAASAPHDRTRDAHVTLNLLGLVGLVVLGTVPFFVATVGRTKTSPRATRATLFALLAWHAVALVTAAAAVLTSVHAVAVAALCAYAVGIAAVTAVLPAPTRRSLRWAGPRLLGVHAGLAWFVAAVVAAAVAVARGAQPFAGRWLLVLVVPAYAQILWGALAYLLPVLRAGGHLRLSEGFARTRSWPGLVLANVAGVLLALGASWPAGLAVACWCADTVARAVSLAPPAHEPGS